MLLCHTWAWIFLRRPKVHYRQMHQALMTPYVCTSTCRDSHSLDLIDIIICQIFKVTDKLHMYFKEMIRAILSQSGPLANWPIKESLYAECLNRVLWDALTYLEASSRHLKYIRESGSLYSWTHLKSHQTHTGTDVAFDLCYKKKNYKKNYKKIIIVI